MYGRRCRSMYAIRRGRVRSMPCSRPIRCISCRGIRSCIFFAALGGCSVIVACLCVYGPFLYADGETVPSNIAFDQWLRARDAESGLRSFEAVNELAGEQSLALQADHQMPANNRLLVWRRI